MKDLFSVTLSAKQIAKACEGYVLDAYADTQLVARAEMPDGLKTIIVRVSTKRRKPRDKTAEAKQAGTRG